MASQYIKIFNDTVLKQSILQGYESQRQNPNLGKFTSGELAFTRDTGRVFVGNFSDTKNDKDLQAVDGGILVGNKYLGIIDSRPIAYVQDKTTGSTGLIGLSYENENANEEALFKTNTRVKKEGNTNDWNNDPSFNSTYGAYNGDYLYDVWRNALIIFDNNIKPNSNAVTVKDPFTTEEKVFDKLNTNITETGRIRTPIEDLSNNKKMKDYPIYGNGYVIFRLLEPDGKTIRFQPREITSTDTYGKNIGNWTHNILEVDFSADNIISAFNNATFANNGGTIDINNLKLKSNSTVELPRLITFKYEDENDGNDENDKSLTFDFVDGIKGTTTGDAYILGYKYDKIKDNIILKPYTTDGLKELVKSDTNITIKTEGNLRVNNTKSHTGIEFTLSINEPTSTEPSQGVSDPWGCGVVGLYLGVGKYEEGILTKVNDYSPTFKKTNDQTAEQNKNIFNNTIEQFLASDYKEIDLYDDKSVLEEVWNCNVGLNYLKEAYDLESLKTSEGTISVNSIEDFTRPDDTKKDFRLIPNHAESIIVSITTAASTATDKLLSTAAKVEVTGCDTPLFETLIPSFTTTVEIPLIPETIVEYSTDDNGNTEYNDKGKPIKIITKVKGFSFKIKNCSAKLLGYRL